MKTTEERKVRKKKVKIIGKKKPQEGGFLRAEFDGQLVALMKVKPPKKED